MTWLSLANRHHHGDPSGKPAISRGPFPRSRDAGMNTRMKSVTWPWFRSVLLPSGRELRVALAVIAMVGLGFAWWRYPEENRYSILTSTISYLGSPDPDRNPQGWRTYQVGMTALILLMELWLCRRHEGFRCRRSVLGQLGSAPLMLAMGMLLVSVWIPDSRTQEFLGEKATRVHTRLAILAIPVLGIGLTLDTLGRFRMGIRLVRLWPALLFAALVGFGFWKLAEWESMCRADSSLRHWPGDGLHSTPLWEWITFLYLLGHVRWMSKDPPAGGQ